MFMDQFKDFMILFLIAAAVVAGVIGKLNSMARPAQAKASQEN